MKILIILMSCTILLPEVAADCDACTTTWGASVDCVKIKSYMSCLIDTYETDKTLLGCDAIKTKMDEAKTAYDANCGSLPVTDSCLCEVAYYQTTTLDCIAIKTKLTCLFAATANGCNTARTNTDLVTEAKVIGKVIANCITDTCECEAIYHGTDISSDVKKCIAIKTKLTCLFPATKDGCDGSTNIAVITGAKNDGTGTANCISGTPCECEATYQGTEVSTDALNCTAAKNAQVCLGKIESSDDRTCDGNMNSTTYLTGTIKPIVAEVCSGSAQLLNVSAAVGYIMVLVQMFIL